MIILIVVLALMFCFLMMYMRSIFQVSKKRFILVALVSAIVVFITLKEYFKLEGLVGRFSEYDYASQPELTILPLLLLVMLNMSASAGEKQ